MLTRKTASGDVCRVTFAGGNAMQSVGFIGLGNVGGKLAGSLLRNKCRLMVRDLDQTVAQPFIDAGAS